MMTDAATMDAEDRSLSRPGERELAGLDPEADGSGYRTYKRPPFRRTLLRLENPLSSDGAYYLRRYLQQFPTRTDRQILRDERDQFLARLEGVA